MKITTQNIIRILLVLLMMTGSIQWGSVACAQSLPGSGTEEDPYVIKSAADWSTFVSDIKSRYDYNGKFVKLTADIDIGNSPVMFNFRGTLDGDGHTMIVALSNCAIFKVTNSATIKNLRVSGTINYSNKFAGSFIEECSGTTTIENCISVATIISTISGDASSGGFVGKVDPYVTLTIKNCLFQGKLLGPDATDCGGFVGTGTHETSECIVQNSFFNPSEITIGSTGSRTISRCTNDLTIANCYYTRVFGEAQGENVAIMSNSEILSGLGDSWTQQDNHFYLKAFCKNVQIKGWVVGETANAPYFENNHGILSSEQYPIYYKGKDDDQYTTTVPSAVGMYTVKTKIYDSWESTKNFWIVNPPTAIEGLTYNGLDQPLLSASETTTAAGTYYYRLGEDGEWSPSIPTAKDKGTYTVYYYVKSNNPSDYSDIGSETAYAGRVSVTIGPKSDGLTISAEDCTYNGIAQTPAVTVKDGDTVVDPSEYTVSSYTNNVLAGTGSVTVKDNPGGNYTVSGTATFTINRKVLTKPAIKLSPTTMTYTGSALKPEVTVYDSEDEIDESEYSVSYSDNTNVGTAKVTVSDKENGNYSITTTVATFTVNKAQLGSTAPKAKSLTYNGTAQELVTAGTVSGADDVSGCTMMYSTDGSNYSASVPTGTDAKTYTVYYKVMGDSNHKDISASSVSVGISPKTVTNPTITVSPSFYIYDGRAKEPEVTVKDGDTEIATSEYTVSYSDNTNVGTATVRISDNEDGNYKVSGTCSFVILSEDAIYIPPTAKVGLTYNGEAQELLTSGSTTTGMMQYSLDGKIYSTDIPKGTDAKTYTVYYKVEGDANHTDSKPATIEVTINRKVLAKPAIKLSPTTMTYTGSALKPEVTVYDSEDEIDESEYSVSYSDNTNVGTAKVTVSDKENGNYSITTTVATFTVNKAQLGSTAPKAKSLTYNGTAQELVTAGTVSGADDVSGCTMMYSTDGSNYSASVPTGTDAKTYTVYYKVTGDSNHKDISASSITVTISAKKLYTSAISLSQTSYTYDGTAKEPTVTVKDGNTPVPSSEYTVNYLDNIDTGTATVIVTDNPGGNYEVSGSVQFTITSGDATYTPPSAKQGLTYNKKDQELVDAGRATNGVMKYSLDNQTYSTTIPTGKDAKDYIVYFKVTGDPNHADMAAQTIMVTISPKTVSLPKISVVPSSLVYDGTEQKPTVIVKDGRDEIDESEYTVNYVDNIKIGTAAITITDNEGGNYTVSGSATFKIVDALEFEVVPEAKSGLVYNGKSQELVTPGVAPEGTMLYSLDGMNYNIDIPTGMDAGKYIVYYKVVDENGVTKGSTSTITVTISPKEVSCNVIVTGRGQFLAPSVEVIDENDQLLEPDGYEVVFRNTDEDEVIPDAYGRMEAGFYRVIVTPTGNYAGPSVSTTFRIRGELSFKFEMHSDVITICLPFTRSLPSYYEAYRFDHINMDDTPVFELVKTKQLQAGEPYVLKYVGSKSSTRATTRILDLSPSNPALVDLSTPLRQQQNGDLCFIGTFDDLSNQKASTLGAYTLHSNNSWRASASEKEGDNHKTYLEAFHAYLFYRDHSTPDEELTVIIPGVVVGIDKIILEDEAGEQRWYDLNGRRIDKPQKGVNILRTASGKTRKVVIK